MARGEKARSKTPENEQNQVVTTQLLLWQGKEDWVFTWNLHLPGHLAPPCEVLTSSPKAITHPSKHFFIFPFSDRWRPHHREEEHDNPPYPCSSEKQQSTWGQEGCGEEWSIWCLNQKKSKANILYHKVSALLLRTRGAPFRKVPGKGPIPTYMN